MIRRLLNVVERFRPYRSEWVEDLPDLPRDRTVYIIGGREHPFHAAIVCPRSACRQVIHLDISHQVSRRWRMTEHEDGRISLAPSVHVTDLPCKCHYWMRKGTIMWSDVPPLFVPRENRDAS